MIYYFYFRLVVEKLKWGEFIIFEVFEVVIIFFFDIVGFIIIVLKILLLDVVDFLNEIYMLFDVIIFIYDVYKVSLVVLWVKFFNIYVLFKE